MSHNATAIPVKRPLPGASPTTRAASRWSTSPTLNNPREVAFADVSDATGTSDEWSSYWYNGRIYSNCGLGPRGRDGEPRPRRLQAHRLARRGTARAKRWAYSNPQTQEAWQAP